MGKNKTKNHRMSRALTAREDRFMRNQHPEPRGWDTFDSNDLYEAELEENFTQHRPLIIGAFMRELRGFVRETVKYTKLEERLVRLDAFLASEEEYSSIVSFLSGQKELFGLTEMFKVFPFSESGKDIIKRLHALAIRTPYFGTLDIFPGLVPALFSFDWHPEITKTAFTQDKHIARRIQKPYRRSKIVAEVGVQAHGVKGLKYFQLQAYLVFLEILQRMYGRAYDVWCFAPEGPKRHAHLIPPKEVCHVVYSFWLYLTPTQD